jgi:hypothetical protein
MTNPQSDEIERVAGIVRQKAERWREQTGRGDWVCALQDDELQFIVREVRAALTNTTEGGEG